MKNELLTEFSTRQYMLDQNFEIFYYSDTNMKSVSNHTHDYYEFYFFLEGDVEMMICGDSYTLSYGNLIVIPPQTPHHVIIKDNKKLYRRFVFWLSNRYMDDLISLSSDFSYIFTCMENEGTNIFSFDDLSFGNIQARVFDLIEETHADRFGKEIRVSICIENLLILINRTLYENRHIKAPGKDDNLFRSLTQYIENHLDEDLSLDHLSGIFYVSKYHIAHIFKDNMGISTHRFITKQRLSKCRDAIINGAGITDACSRYGFTDYSVFYRAFQKEYGISPKKFRDDIIKQNTWLSGES